MQRHNTVMDPDLERVLSDFQALRYGQLSANDVPQLISSFNSLGRELTALCSPPPMALPRSPSSPSLSNRQQPFQFAPLPHSTHRLSDYQASNINHMTAFNQQRNMKKGMNKPARVKRHSLYKIKKCKNFSSPELCPYKDHCQFAHSEEELEFYRAKRAAKERLDPSLAQAATASTVTAASPSVDEPSPTTLSPSVTALSMPKVAGVATDELWSFAPSNLEKPVLARQGSWLRDVGNALLLQETETSAAGMYAHQPLQRAPSWSNVLSDRPTRAC